MLGNKFRRNQKIEVRIWAFVGALQKTLNELFAKPAHDILLGDVGEDGTVHPWHQLEP